MADAREVERLGADLLGVNFVGKSKRFVDVEMGRSIVGCLEGKAEPVGLFQDHDLGEVLSTADEVGLKMVQLHGGESVEYVNELLAANEALRVLRAFAFTGAETLDSMLQWYDGLERKDRLFAFLLDGPWGGGSGRAFDWDGLAEALSDDRYVTIREKLILAGGLHSQNVSLAIRMIGPMGVDVSTGVEKSPGIKDATSMEAFIREARTAL